MFRLIQPCIVRLEADCSFRQVHCVKCVRREVVVSQTKPFQIRRDVVTLYELRGLCSVEWDEWTEWETKRSEWLYLWRI
jgi:hypothetical protein